MKQYLYYYIIYYCILQCYVLFKAPLDGSIALWYSCAYRGSVSLPEYPVREAGSRAPTIFCLQTIKTQKCPVECLRCTANESLAVLIEVRPSLPDTRQLLVRGGRDTQHTENCANGGRGVKSLSRCGHTGPSFMATLVLLSICPTSQSFLRAPDNRHLSCPSASPWPLASLQPPSTPPLSRALA